jgi:hypothetical protein
MALQHKKTLKYFHFAKFTAANFGKITKFDKTQLTSNLNTKRNTNEQFFDIASRRPFVMLKISEQKQN